MIGLTFHWLLSAVCNSSNCNPLSYIDHIAHTIQPLVL